MTERETDKTGYGQMHLHTPASDGLITPQDIIESGLKFTFITDHDSMQNVDAYKKAIHPYGITVLPGVEITTNHLGKDLHVLLYMPISADGSFEKNLALMRQRRMDRGLEITKRLRGLGFMISDDFIIKQNGAISKGNITEEILKSEENKTLLAKRRIYSNPQFVNAYLEEGCPAHVRMSRISLSEYIAGVNAIKVLAHPAKDLVVGKDDYVIEDLVRNHNFAGIEMITGDRQGNELTNYQDLVKKLGIVGIRSNDCHAKTQLEKRQESIETLELLLNSQR